MMGSLTRPQRRGRAPRAGEGRCFLGDEQQRPLLLQEGRGSWWSCCGY